MLQQLTDRDLVLATREGDPTAFGELVHRHHQVIYAFLMQLTSHHQDAEDLTQDTFLQAQKKLATFKIDREFKPWLFAISRRLTIARWRRYQPTLPLLDSDHPQTEPDQTHDHIALWKVAQSSLKADEFLSLWLHYQEGLSVKEVAQGLNKTLTHSKVILHRARKKLAAKLTSTSDDWLSDQPLPTSSPTHS